MYEERRKAKRVSVPLEGRWRGASGENHEARVSNLSQVGCYLETTEQALAREPVEIELRLPDGRYLAIKGQAVFNIPNGGIGVYFTENNQARENLIRFIEHYVTGGGRC
jgi:c-di-GMP-binding flagellar brake protein YcgR